MIKRILIIASCVALLVCALALPASAVSYTVVDYNDYIDSITTSDGYDSITISGWENGVWFGGGASGYAPEKLSTRIVDSVKSVYYSPTRDIYGNEKVFPKSDFPDDTGFMFAFQCETENVPRQGYFYLDQYDENFNRLSSTYQAISITSSVADDWGTWVTTRTGTLNFVSDCAYFCFCYEFSTYGKEEQQADGSTEYWYTFQNAEFFMNFTIDSLVRQQNNTNKTNNILKAVENQLAENGQTLEEVLQQQQQTNDKLDGIQGSLDDTNNKLGEIINGDVPLWDPPDSDIVGDLDDVEQGIRDEISIGFGEGEKSIAEAIQLLSQYTSAFLAINFVFNCFGDIPFFRGLLYVSMALGLFAVLVGVVPPAISRAINNHKAEIAAQNKSKGGRKG